MVQFAKIIPNAILPSRGSRHSAGLDLSAAWEGSLQKIFIPSGGRSLIPTGLKVAIPYGYYGQIHPRSGLALKNGIDVFAGVIDADYRGEVKIILFNSDEQPFIVECGMRVAQFIIKPCNMQDAEEVPSLPEPATEGFRGSAGFGSTGV